MVSPDIYITVGIITFNRPELLKEAVRSVLNQTYSNYELIISNDNPDVVIGLKDIGTEFDSRIKIVNQVTNLGVLENMNYLLSVAHGEWFVWLSEDDLLHPDFFRVANNEILRRQNDNIVGFFSNYMSKPSPYGVFPAPLKDDARMINSLSYHVGKFLENYSNRMYPVVGECGLMRIDVLKKIGGIPKLGSGPGHYSDTLIPILMLEYGSICWLDDNLVFFRASPGSISHDSTDFSAYTSAEADFLKHLYRVCASDTVNVRPDNIIANMIRWFSLLEWQVLSRTPSLTRLGAFILFARYQINVNIPKLTLKHKITHILFLFSNFIILIYKKVYTILRTRITGLESTTRW